MIQHFNYISLLPSYLNINTHHLMVKKNILHGKHLFIMIHNFDILYFYEVENILSVFSFLLDPAGCSIGKVLLLIDDFIFHLEGNILFK